MKISLNFSTFICNFLKSLIVIVVLLPLMARCADVAAIARAVDNHYNHLQTLQTDFVETYNGAGTERVESGTLLLKKTGKMRWEYRSPKEKLFLSNGKSAWFSIPGEKQVRKISMRQLDDLRSPLAFLLGKSKLQKEIKGLSLATDISPMSAGNIILSGLPAGMEELTKVVLEITPNSAISKIVLEGTDGSTTEYRFTNQKENVPIPEQQFRFLPPPGTEIVDGDFRQ